MPSTFPCPNPTCTHVFSPDAVKGASKLVCPRCGAALQFRPAAAALKPTGTKPKTPPPLIAAPPPRTAAPSVPPPLPAVPPAVAETVEPVEPPATLDFNTESAVVVPPPLRRRAERKSPRRVAPLLAVFVIIALGVGVAVWGGMWLLHLNRIENADAEPLRAAGRYNFQFVPPGEPWKRDRNIELKLRVNFAMRSSERNNNFGLLFKDYETRMPHDNELVDEAAGRLHSYFRGPEWAPKPKDKNVQLGGHPALVLEFEGEDPEHVGMSGECYAVAFRGYAYWFFTWAPTEDKELVRPDWSGLRERFSLLNERVGWTEKRRAAEKIRGTKAKYELSCAKELWTRQTAADYDPLADVALRGDEPDPRHKKYVRRMAIFQVLVLPEQPDLQAAVKAARAYLQQRQEQEYPKTSIKPIKDKNEAEVDRNIEIDEEEGHLHLSKLHVQNAEDRERFMVLAVVNRPGGVLVLLGDCPWDRREFWDPEFMALIDSLKVR